MANNPTGNGHSPPQTLEAEVTVKAASPGIRAGAESAPGAAGAGWLATGNASMASSLKLEANRQGPPRNPFTDLIKSNRVDFAFLLTAALIDALLAGFHSPAPV